MACVTFYGRASPFPPPSPPSLLVSSAESLSSLAVLEEKPFVNEQSLDPFESFNRTVFSFNLWADDFLVLPLSVIYQWACPPLVQKGFHNFFSNLKNPCSVVNALLQGKTKEAGIFFVKFFFNSTCGLLGLVDASKHLNLPASPPENFGRTLQRWGASQGLYIVLPLVGPTTARDFFGLGFDTLADPTYLGMRRKLYRNLWTGLDYLDQRHQQRTSYTHFRKNSWDFYIFVRSFYLQQSS